MGGKPRKPAQRAVWWLTKDVEDGAIRLWREQPFRGSAGTWFSVNGQGVQCCAGTFDIDVPTDRPIKVRLRCEVVD